MPNLNEEKALPYFLRSLAAQTLKPFELIIVDGGSTDHSLKIVDQYVSTIPIQVLVDYTRNLGYVRNLGAKYARGDILFFTNSDAILPFHLLNGILWRFQEARLFALSGRTVPYGGGSLCFAAYYCFDLIRSFMANHMGRFSPSGNFLAIKKDLFWKLRGFPEVSINEDGKLGQEISKYSRSHGGKLCFDLHLSTGHFAKRFKRGPLKTLLFYTYVFGNFSSLLARILAPVERSSGEAFRKR